MQSVRKKKAMYCGPDTVWQREFEEMFPYEETEDQLSMPLKTPSMTWKARKIMDRLVCGDVGYGKTEDRPPGCF